MNVSEKKNSIGLVYHFVNYENLYNIGNDVMVAECMPRVNHIHKGMIYFDYVSFHYFLKTQFDNRLFQIK